jgi:hypothetical protein
VVLPFLDDTIRYARALGELPPTPAGRAAGALLAWSDTRADAALARLSDAAVARLLGTLPPPVAAAVTRSLPRDRRGTVLDRLSPFDRRRVEDRLRWPADTLGALAHDGVQAAGPWLHAALPLERALDADAEAFAIHDDGGLPVGTVWREELVWWLGQRSVARALQRAEQRAKLVPWLAAAAVMAATALALVSRHR